MQQDLRRQFLTDVQEQLKSFYQDLKMKRKMDMQQKHRIEGFMFAGARLGLTENHELEALMEKVHSDVFGMSIAERRLMSLKGEEQAVDWAYYDTPITQRS